MARFEGKIIDPAGIHARPAAVLANTAGKFDSSVELVFNGKNANMKSIMGIMALGITANSDIAIEVNGSDEDAALTALVDALKANKIAE